MLGEFSGVTPYPIRKAEMAQSEAARERHIRDSLARLSPGKNEAVVIAKRHSALGLEWRIILVRASSVLLSKEARRQHVQLRRREFYRFEVCYFVTSGVNEGIRQSPISYMKLIAESKPKRSLVKAAELV